MLLKHKRKLKHIYIYIYHMKVWDMSLLCNISRSPVSLLVVQVFCRRSLLHFLVTAYKIEDKISILKWFGVFFVYETL